ncbi:MAG: type II toxin-antitoxin system PemK/MazF family toxin [Anaerolineales bacterium]|nr:type II toxin-antitoxin system PemK/MazF family toxin [Anaerolineales bacterium]
MGRFVKGEVVVLPFPFSDLSASKKRPALVIASLESYDDVILCMITSQHTKDGNAIFISAADFEFGGLPKASNVRPNRLFTADANIILRSVGKLSAEKVDQVVTEIVRLITR